MSVSRGEIMSSLTDVLLDFKTVQLEGRLAIYESLITDMVKLEAMEAMASEIKLKLEDVITIWNSQASKGNNGS